MLRQTVGRIVGVSASLGSYENCYACESIVLKVNEKTITASDESSATGTTFHGVAKSAEELGNTHRSLESESLEKRNERLSDIPVV